MAEVGCRDGTCSSWERGAAVMLLRTGRPIPGNSQGSVLTASIHGQIGCPMALCARVKRDRKHRP